MIACGYIGAFSVRAPNRFWLRATPTQSGYKTAHSVHACCCSPQSSDCQLTLACYIALPLTVCAAPLAADNGHSFLTCQCRLHSFNLHVFVNGFNQQCMLPTPWPLIQYGMLRALLALAAKTIVLLSSLSLYAYARIGRQPQLPCWRWHCGNQRGRPNVHSRATSAPHRRWASVQ